MLEEGDEETPPLYGFEMPEKSIGAMKAFWGNFGMIVRAFAYIMIHGAEGLRAITDHAVLNANYIRVNLKDIYSMPFERIWGMNSSARHTMRKAFTRWTSKRLMDAASSADELFR
jgi:glycine cleavage system protein P-like pyridoxal-binding family